MKKILLVMCSFLLTIMLPFSLVGCTKKVDMAYAISSTIETSEYKDHFTIQKSDRRYFIKANDAIANTFLAIQEQDKGVIVYVYLTNSGEHFYNAKMQNITRAITNLDRTPVDVLDNTLKLKVTTAHQGSLTAKVLVSQGNTAGVYSVNSKGKKAVDFRPLELEIVIETYNAQ